MLDTLTAPDEEFAADVLDGLGRPQKTLPCRWLYDDRGSQLFEEITDLPEYYPTRTETKILEACRVQALTYDEISTSAIVNFPPSQAIF